MTGASEDQSHGLKSLDAWSDEPDPIFSVRAVTAFTALVVPSERRPTEIVLDGCCPRCSHPMISIHPLRSLISPDEALASAIIDGLVPLGGVRRITAECHCRHEHPDAPAGEVGCGAPFSLWISWAEARSATGQRQVSVAPSSTTSVLELHEERALQASSEAQLTSVRHAAESWRTGLAGFMAILVAVFFIKGKTSFSEISGTRWRVALAVLLITSAGSALFGSYRALRAAYGTPRDEFLGEVPWLFRLLPETTPRNIYEYGTVSAWQYAFARQAVNDLRLAKVATVVSLTAVVAAAAITWLTP
jgi:hypothetical protein